MEEHGATQTEQHRRLMKEYADVPDGLGADGLRAWFAASVDYARGLKPKATKRR